MPIFEYLCRTCDHRFETLVTGSHRPVCPTCQGRDLQKQLSVFVVATRERAAASVAPCGTCGDPGGPGACSLN